ncbi:MAG TPA: plastocyanin/azurin family copper-binding protein [Candidatus Binatia bacterium]|nr:plastocyanin/azurin family copper-binding protein [Candidatus Binatia bacterium]
MTRLRALGLILVVAAGLVAACGDGQPSTSGSGGSSGGSSSSGGQCTSCGTVGSGPAAVTVDATDADKFQPATVDIKVGQIVKWTNTGSQAHTVTFTSDGAISDSDLTSGQTFEVKFTQAGSWGYECTFHVALGMTGTVTVSAG